MSAPTISVEALRGAVAGLPDDSLSPARRQALDHFDQFGLPTTRHEDWKYTDLKSIVEISNRWLASGAKIATNAANAVAIDSVCRDIDAHWLIIANGIIVEESLAAARALGINVSLLTEHTTKIGFDVPLTDLNTALLRDGIHMQIGADLVLQKPIGFLIIDDADSGTSVSQTRIEIDLAANSQSRFIEFHASTGDLEHYANGIIDMTLGDGAKTDVVRIQDRQLNHSQTTRFSAILNRDSQLNYCGFDLGGRLVRNDMHVDIIGSGATAIFDGFYLAGDDQHIDNHTRVDHRVGPAVSMQEYRGILTGTCQCVWNGKAVVHAGADGTDARQQNHNLLLSEKSEIDAKPELEIYADDVKCSHGTTVGQLDESAIFYLRTRGLSEQFAKQVLTRAFAGSIVNKSPISEIRQNIAERVEKRLCKIIDLDNV
jgi:Fe-S cluster assembly protein SufD